MGSSPPSRAGGAGSSCHLLSLSSGAGQNRASLLLIFLGMETQGEFTAIFRLKNTEKYYRTEV